MSASDPNSAIYVTDSAKDIKNKVRRFLLSFSVYSRLNSMSIMIYLILLNGNRCDFSLFFYVTLKINSVYIQSTCCTFSFRDLIHEYCEWYYGIGVNRTRIIILSRFLTTVIKSDGNR